MVEGFAREELVEGIDRLLHELCQPLTVLQCRLAIGELEGEPEAMREAIEMVYARGLLLREIASSLGTAEETVKKRVQRARASLADCLNRMGGSTT